MGNLNGGKMKELFTALALAQAEMEAATKDSANPFFKSKYADLNSVMGAVKPAFAKHGLAFIQICHDAEHAAKVETVIIHESGQQFSCGSVSVPVSKIDAQGYGSALTYARRYSLAAAAGVGAEDDDGNAAAKAKPAKVELPKAGPEAHSPARIAFEMLDADTQDYLRTVSMDVKTLCRKDDIRGAVERIEIEDLDADSKAGLWSLLDSKERSAIKAAAKVAA